MLASSVNNSVNHWGQRIYSLILCHRYLRLTRSQAMITCQLYLSGSGEKPNCQAGRLFSMTHYNVGENIVTCTRQHNHVIAPSTRAGGAVHPVRVRSFRSCQATWPSLLGQVRRHHGSGATTGPPYLAARFTGRGHAGCHTDCIISVI